MDTLIIRKFRKEDRTAVRDIAWNTAFFGEPADNYCDAREIISDILTGYFTDYEPESCFVADLNGTVIGYLTGATQEARFNKTFSSKILPRVVLKGIINLTVFKKKNIRFLYHLLLSCLKGEFKIHLDVSTDYPAILHINVVKGYRNLDLGSKLINAYFGYLIDLGISGVHLGTLSDKAARFFEKHGFTLLLKNRWSVYNHILHKDVTYYCYGRKFDVRSLSE